MENEYEKPDISPIPEFASAEIGIDLTGFYKKALSKEDYDKFIAKNRAKALFKEAGRTVLYNTYEHKYQQAMIQGMYNLFGNIEGLVKLVRNSHLDKKYRGSITYNIRSLQRCRDKDFLESYYRKIDERIKELNILLALMDAYWYKNDVVADKSIFSMHDYLTSKIKTNYARRNEDPKFLDIAIEACEKQIGLAKNLARKIKKGEKLFTVKSVDEIIADFDKVSITEQKIKYPKGFNPNIHKSPDEYEIISGKLGIHAGYNQLSIIREKQGNWLEVIKLAKQAKAEGWAGDWDKRIEKAKKKLSEIIA
jgi:hypothetical protein